MKIVFGTDGSEHSRFVEELLSRYPLSSEDSVECCSAYSAARIVTATSHPFLGPILADQITLAVEGAKEAANRNASEAAKRLSAAGIQAHGVVLEGEPADALSRYATEQNAAFVVVGSRGEGTLVTLLLGSVARELSNMKSMSLLVCRKREFCRPSGLSVVFATDHSDYAKAVAEKLPTMVSGKFGHLEVVSILDVVPPEVTAHIRATRGSEKWEEGLLQWHDDETKKLADSMSGLAESVSHRVTKGNAREELLKIKDCDLMILGARGRSGAARLFLGSVSHYVLHRQECSVMVVRV